MPPKTYDKYYIKFEKYLEEKEDRNDINAVRNYSKEFATNIRGIYDLYARKYHAFIFTKWCDEKLVDYPSDWNSEGFWLPIFK